MEGKDVEITGGPDWRSYIKTIGDDVTITLPPRCEGFDCGGLSSCEMVYSGIDIMTGETIWHPVLLCDRCAKLVREYDGAILSIYGRPYTYPLAYADYVHFRLSVLRFLKEFARVLGLNRLMGVK